MFSSQYSSAKKHHPLDFFHRIENEWGSYMPENVQNRINLLKIEFKFIDIFLTIQNFTNDPNMLKNVIHKVDALFHDSAFDTSKKYQNLERLTSLLQDKIWIIKIDIRANYSFFPRTSLQLLHEKNGIGNSKFVMEFIDGVIQNLSSKFMMEFIDGIVQNLCELVEIGDSNSVQIQEVLKELKLLKNLVGFLSKWCVDSESVYALFAHVLFVAGFAAMVAWLYMPGREDNGNEYLVPGEMNFLLSYIVRMRTKPVNPRIRKIYVDVLLALKGTMQSGLSRSIQNLYSVEIEAGFLEIFIHNLEEIRSICTLSRMEYLNHQMGSLEEMLKLLRANLISLPIQGLEFHLQDIDIVIVDVGLLIYSLYDREKQEEANQRLFLDLPRSIQHIKEVIFLVIRWAFQSNLPRVHGLGCVDFLLNNLKEFQVRYSDSHNSFVKNQLQVIQKELESLQPFLKDVAEELYNKHERLQHCAALLNGKAYEVEYIVDASIGKGVPDWCLVRWLFDIIKEIILIREEVAKIQEKRVFNFALHDTLDTEELTNTPRMTEEVVGFEDVMEKLREQLISGSKQLDVISVVGMPGLGKTTVANKLYSDEFVVSRFEIRAQCCVSQAYSRRNVLLSILRDAIGESPTLAKLSTDILADQLRKILLRKRYLILVDDVWEASVWDDLRCCFHDDNNGSRIILTTQHGGVAENAKSVSDPLYLRLLNDDESWKLLKQKVFGEESCSVLFSNIGKEIANKCRGLPLSIVLVAGMLTKMKKSEICWKQVAMNLCTDILSNSKTIIEQSYQSLPYHLKPCFLYFGVFLEDKEINVSILTWLWIAEGFIKSRDDKSLEDIAEGYLESLIGRNLVTVAKWSSSGKVKTCRIHDLLLCFCKERAKEKNLLRWMKRNLYLKVHSFMNCYRDQNVNTSSSIYSHKQLIQRHMSFNSEVVNLVEWISSCSLVGAVSFMEGRNKGSFSIVQSSHIYFRFIKVLNLEFIVIDSFPTELVYLRYFAARTSQKSITSSIANLRNLETLIVKPMRGKLILPLTLLKMVKLRHLQIYSKAHFTLNAAEESLETAKFVNLITLSSPTFCCVRDAELMLRTPNLRKLRCSFVGWGYPSREMSSLTRLETLSIKMDSCGSSPSNFPPNLKKLTLSNFTMYWLQSSIAMLPNLQVLKLVAVFFSKAEWKVRNDMFHQLKVLKVVDCPCFKKWNISDDAFPRLEHLVLRRCRYLEVIPSRFGDIPSLISIEVNSCKESLVESAMVIRETQVEVMQNYDFKVFIHK
ncbi:putative late blight resistance protein -like protein R1B-23 [Capsicum annuum]|uniref:Late blight resistance protein -like protein R1B-23 n=1 Tax=Capsicum annuum TaxID=4072 RepID=A0A2G2YDN0_CAPAN|nr:putative late blight resistance protein -like protein R1B-23 [Capsicum annuum]